MQFPRDLIRFFNHPIFADQQDQLPKLRNALTGEFLGTFVMVFFGTGVVHAAVISGAQMGLWQVAVVWSIAVTLGIYTAATLSGAHINPAITLVVAVFDGFPWRRVGLYWIAQIAGAAAAGLILLLMYSGCHRCFRTTQ